MKITTAIELLNLADLAIKVISCPDRIYTAIEAAELLTDRSGEVVTADMYLEFREQYLKGNVDISLLPQPIVPAATSILSVPATINEMMNYAQIDTLKMRKGVMHELFRVYSMAMEEGKLREATTALRGMLEASESFDKKVRALDAADQAADIMSTEAFRTLQEALLQVHKEHPELHLTSVIRDKVKELQESRGMGVNTDGP